MMKVEMMLNVIVDLFVAVDAICIDGLALCALIHDCLHDKICLFVHNVYNSPRKVVSVF